MSDALDRAVDAAADARRLASAGRAPHPHARAARVLLREAWLQHRRFYVDRRAIVPRSHIAELLPDGLSRHGCRDGRPRRVLDLCTGSGCLAILAALAFPRARVDASDVSSAALAVARRNVAAYRLRRRVRLVRSDLFDALGDARYDLILCNPPYVPAERDAAVYPTSTVTSRSSRSRAAATGSISCAGCSPQARHSSRAARRAGRRGRRRDAGRSSARFRGLRFTWLAIERRRGLGVRADRAIRLPE